MKRKNYLQAIAIALLVIGLIALYVLEFRYFNRTLNVSGLVGWSILIGTVAGALLGYRFQKRAEDRVERIQIFVFFMILTPLFTPLFASLSNRLLVAEEPRQVPVEFIKEEPRYADRFGITEQDSIDPNQFFIFFYKDGAIHRVKSDAATFPEKERGDTVSIPLKRGLWGYDIVQLQ